MKLLAFTDTHADVKDLDSIKKKALKEKPEMLVCCGDISIFGNGLNFACSFINDLGIKTLIIPGNHEEPSQIENVCSKFKNLVNLHKKTFERKNFVFLGYGTGGFSDKYPEFEALYPKLLKNTINKKIIFVAHAPVYNTKLDLLHGSHCGSKSSRDFLDKVNPVLVLCGHIHENEKKHDKIKNSLIINPGSDGMIIEI
ncbi:MAG TPA: metallophosphoesterase [Candidatus Nanoarchaeia archaeon]|nr:metallophosphoesterase [Candidatus Nanoarchaeia archaeon]